MALIIGTPLDDSIIGTNQADSISGLAGNDTLRGRNGADRLFGGDGDDEIIGGERGDTLFGGAGNDTLDGTDGSDKLYGGPGDDEISAGRLGAVFFQHSLSDYTVKVFAEPSPFFRSLDYSYEIAGRSAAAIADDGTDFVEDGAALVFADIELSLRDADLVRAGSDVFETFGAGGFRIASPGARNDILANDFRETKLTEINGNLYQYGQWIDGSNGGQFRVFDNGAVDFRNPGLQFTEADGQTGFTYTFTNGTSTATTFVTLAWEDTAPVLRDDSYTVSVEDLAAADWVRLGARDDRTRLVDNDNVDEIVFVNGRPIRDGEWFGGDNGGQFRVFDGGVVDFRNIGSAIDPGEETGFSYGVVRDGVLDVADVTLTLDLI